MAREIYIGFRVNEEEAAAIERAAAKEGRTVSDYVRRVLMIDKMLVWDSTAMREIRRKVEDLIEERERELAPKETKKRA